MRVLPPLTITAAMLTSSTAPEPGVGEAAYSDATTYIVGDRVILGAPSSTVTISIASPGVVTWNDNGLPDGTPVVITTSGALPTGLVAGTIYYVVNRATNTFQLAAEASGAGIVTTGGQSGTHTATAQLHRIYESQSASNLDNPPAIDDGTNWLDVGPTNRHACFDLLRNTATTFPASPGVVVLTPGQRIDSVGLVGIVADSVTVTLTVSAVVVYTHTESLLHRPTTTAYEYCFGAFIYKTALALFDLPPYVGGVVTVTLTRASGLPSLGGLLVGRSVYLGRTLHNATAAAENYSSVTRDEFGNATLIPRRNVPKTDQTVRCAKAAANKALAVRDALNAVPALWSGLDDTDSGYFQPLLILGVYNTFDLVADQPEEATITLQLQEV